MSHESTPAAERGIGRSPTHLEARDLVQFFFPPANKVLPLVVPSLRLPSDARLWRGCSVGGVEVLSRHRVLIESFMPGIKREGENQ